MEILRAVNVPWTTVCVHTNFPSLCSFALLAENYNGTCKVHGSQWSRKSAPSVSMTTTNIKRIPGLVLWFSQLCPDWSHLLRFFKGDMSRFDMLHAACSQALSQTHTHTTKFTINQSWYMTDIYSVRHRITGREKMYIRDKLQTGNRGRILSPSTWHALISFDRVKQLVQNSVCPPRIDFKSPWIGDVKLTFPMYSLKLSELIKRSSFLSIGLDDQIKSHLSLQLLTAKKEKKSYPVQVRFLPVTIKSFPIYTLHKFNKKK